MATLNPQIVRLKAELSDKNLEAVVEGALDWIRKAGLPAPVSFESPLGSTAKPIDRLDPAKLVRAQVDLVLEDGTRVTISTPAGAAGSLIQASRAGDNLSEENVRAAQTQQTKLLAALHESGQLTSGHVERIDELVDSLASVPLARRLPAVVVTDAQVDNAYQDPAPFWAAWDEDRVQGEHHLLWRHLDAASTPAWYRACFDDQWEMARAARPGDTFFGGKVAPPGCEKVMMKGESRLRQTGYRDGLVELAGYVPDGAHVPPWEILTWSEALLRGNLDDGSPVTSLQVVFRTEEMARREGTPFLDLGATVAFLGRDGQYHSLE